MVVVRRKPIDNSSDLVHHGIKGQKKGVRNGPPYPLSRGYSAAGLPTYQLPKAEYAHVMSEVASHITDEQRKQDAFSKQIGEHTYYFENMHDGTYRVVGKRKTINRMGDYWDDD